MFSWIWGTEQTVTDIKPVMKDSVKSVSVVFASAADLQLIRQKLKPVSTNNHRSAYAKLNPICGELENMFRKDLKESDTDYLDSVFDKIKQKQPVVDCKTYQLIKARKQIVN